MLGILFGAMDEKVTSTSPTPSTFGKQGLILHCQAREIVANVIDFMKKEAENYRRCNTPLIPINNFRERVIAATGVSRQMYTSITKESKNIADGVSTSFVTPRKKRKRKRELVEEETCATSPEVLWIKMENITTYINGKN